MNNNLKLALALENLMPLGGYTVNKDGIITIQPDGELHGYTVPTEAEIATAVGKIETNYPILEQLKQLDQFITRPKEQRAVDKGIVLPTFEQDVIAEKQILRAQLEK